MGWIKQWSPWYIPLRVMSARGTLSGISGLPSFFWETKEQVFTIELFELRWLLKSHRNLQCYKGLARASATPILAQNWKHRYQKLVKSSFWRRVGLLDDFVKINHKCTSLWTIWRNWRKHNKIVHSCRRFPPTQPRIPIPVVAIARKQPRAGTEVRQSRNISTTCLILSFLDVIGRFDNLISKHWQSICRHAIHWSWFLHAAYSRLTFRAPSASNTSPAILWKLPAILPFPVYPSRSDSVYALSTLSKSSPWSVSVSSYISVFCESYGLLQHATSAAAREYAVNKPWPVRANLAGLLCCAIGSKYPAAWPTSPKSHI